MTTVRNSDTSSGTIALREPGFSSTFIQRMQVAAVVVLRVGTDLVPATCPANPHSAAVSGVCWRPARDAWLSSNRESRRSHSTTSINWERRNSPCVSLTSLRESGFSASQSEAPHNTPNTMACNCGKDSTACRGITYIPQRRELRRSSVLARVVRDIWSGRNSVDLHSCSLYSKLATNKEIARETSQPEGVYHFLSPRQTHPPKTSQTQKHLRFVGCRLMEPCPPQAYERLCRAVHSFVVFTAMTELGPTDLGPDRVRPVRVRPRPT